MLDTSEIRKGLKVQFDGVPFEVVYFQFVKPGKGQAFTRTKLRNMMTGNVIERTFKSGEKLEKADMEEREMQYLYPEDGFYVFMDVKTYDQMRLTGDQLGENKYYLSDGLMCDVLLFNEKPIGVTPPTFVEFEIVETEPGFKGDTSGGTTKPAKTITGLQIQVPLFINQGEMVRIDTRTGEYSERVKK
ncbi:MAG TPA: elongation factor P [Polyangiales bacterium]|nr:elongation factor P [Polyangiales bacterium]